MKDTMIKENSIIEIKAFYVPTDDQKAVVLDRYEMLVYGDMGLFTKKIFYHSNVFINDHELRMYIWDNNLAASSFIIILHDAVLADLMYSDY